MFVEKNSGFIHLITTLRLLRLEEVYTFSLLRFDRPLLSDNKEPDRLAPFKTRWTRREVYASFPNLIYPNFSRKPPTNVRERKGGAGEQSTKAYLERFDPVKEKKTVQDLSLDK